MKINIHIKKIDWKYVKHWLKCTIEDIPVLLWSLIRFHYIAVVSFAVSVYFYPYRFMETGDFINMIAGGAILFLGVGYDISRSNGALY